MLKITPTMRRMIRDKEFFEAVSMLVEAQDRLRDLNGPRRRNDGLDDIRFGTPRKPLVKGV